MLAFLKRSFLVALVLGAVLAPRSAHAAVFGGIEIGAKGIKATAVELTTGADGWEVKVLMSDTRNTTLTAGLGSSRRFDPKALKETAAAITGFTERMIKDHQVPAENIHVVGSSGLFSALKDDKDATDSNRKALAETIRATTGRTMDFVDVRREAVLSISGVVPAKYAAEAVLLDIGGGNTKGGVRKGDKEFVTFGIPYGSVMFADLIAKRAGKEAFADAADALRREVLTPALRKAIAGKPGLTNRDRIYLGGGAVWACATLVKPGDRSNYVTLTTADVNSYLKLLRQEPGQFPALDLSAIADARVREAARKEIEQVKKVFTPEQLLAGAEILKGLADEFHFDKDKKVSFARHAYLGWILAYVVEKGTSR